MATATPTPGAPKRFALSNLSAGKKILASAALAGLAVSIAGLGTWATFTSSTSASQEVTSGSAGLEMPYSDFGAPVTGMLPGDTIERTATLFNPGNSSLKEIILSTTNIEASALVTDPVNGLQLELKTCSNPWTAVPGGADLCGVGERVLMTAPLAALTLMALPNMQAIEGGGQDYLLATISLPSTAEAAFQGLSSETAFHFDAVQRDGKFLD